MPPRTTCWDLEPHTSAKHLILRRYLQAWLPIMTRWNGRVLYIDGFAGPGIYQGGEEGSPIIALKEAINHTAQIRSQVIFLFIEADPARLEVLKQQIGALPVPSNFKVQCLLGKFDEHLTQVLDFVKEQKRDLAPTFAFVDPFGFSHTPFSLIKRLMQNDKCEVLITFMFEAINRFLAHPDQPGNYDSLFGSPDWRGAIPIEDAQARKKFIHDLYLRQLQTSAAITYVRSFEMFDTGNRPEYFLFFGTKSYDGLKKIKEAMWKADESGRFQFSDTTDMNQSLLFQPTPDFSDLKGRIVAKFRGRRVTVDDVERFVVVETPYRETHFKQQVLKPMESVIPPELRVVTRTGQNRRGTFPSGTVFDIL